MLSQPIKEKQDTLVNEKTEFMYTAHFILFTDMQIIIIINNNNNNNNNIFGKDTCLIKTPLDSTKQCFYHMTRRQRSHETAPHFNVDSHCYLLKQFPDITSDQRWDFP